MPLHQASATIHKAGPSQLTGINRQSPITVMKSLSPISKMLWCKLSAETDSGVSFKEDTWVHQNSLCLTEFCLNQAEVNWWGQCSAGMHVWTTALSRVIHVKSCHTASQTTAHSNMDAHFLSASTKTGHYYQKAKEFRILETCTIARNNTYSGSVTNVFWYKSMVLSALL